MSDTNNFIKVKKLNEKNFSLKWFSFRNSSY